MKNENFKKRLALALVPILSLTSVIGNVPILPTSVFAVTQDEVYIEEPMVIEEETLEVEEPAVIVEETEEVEEPEALLNEVPEDLQNLSVVNKDVLNAASTWTITNKKLTSTVEYKVGAAVEFTPVEDTTSDGLDFAGIGTDDVLIKITIDATQTLKTFTYTTAEETVAPVVDSNGEATIENATALKITAIDVEFEDKTTYEISWTITGAGTIAVNGDSSSPYPYVKDADLPEVVFTPGEGKVLTEFKVEGVDKLSKVVSGKYTFEAKPTAAVAITAKFEDKPVTYDISWTVGTGGTLKIGTDETSPYTYTSDGTQITATITPPAGKGIKTFTVTGDTEAMKHLTGTGPYSYTFTPTDNMTLAVTFDNKYDITWSVVGAGSSLSVNKDTDGTYAYINGEGEVTVKFTEAEGYVLTEFKVGTSNQTTAVKNGEYKFTPTKATALSAKFETIVCSIGDVDFASLASAIAYINAQTSATDYTIDILDNMATAVALTLPAATKAKSITLKSAKTGGDPAVAVPVDVAISNKTLAIPTALILDNVVLTNSKGVNLTLSAKASALTVKAGGGIDKVVKVTTAAGKVITLENTTKFEITGNLSGKPNIILKGDLEIAGTVAIGELTYAAAATVSFTKAATATATITKISTIGNVAAVLESGILSLTIGDIDVDTATTTTTGFVIKGRQYAVSTTDKTPVYKITGAVTTAEDKPIELSVYDKADTKYTSLATIDPTTAIITSVKTETTADMFKTANEKAADVVYSFYKDGTALKFGNNFITLNAKAGEGTVEETFIRLQDAFTYIDGKNNLTEVILKVSGDIPSHGALTFPEEDITIQSKEPTGDKDPQAQYKVLFTGSVKLNANLTLKNIELSNGNIKGIAFDLNGKNLTLDTGSKVIFNTVKDTKLPEGTNPKPSKLTVTDSGNLTFLGAITAIGTVDIDDNTIFKGAVSNVAEIDIAADKYAYFRGGAITNTLTYGAASIVYLPTNTKGGITKNITIKATEDAVSGSGKLKVNAVTDTVTPAKDGDPEIITIKTSGASAAVEVQKVNPGAVIVKLVKDSKVLASSFETDAKNFKLTTDQTLIATKAGTAIKIAAPKLTAIAPAIGDPATEEAFSENFVTIEEALAVVGKDKAEREYTLTITDNIVGADLTNIPSNVAVLTAAVPEGDAKPLKIATSKDIGLNGGLTIENLNILAAAKKLAKFEGTGETAKTYGVSGLLLTNATLTISEAYIEDLTLKEDAVITFRKTGFVNVLNLKKGSTVGKMSSLLVENTAPDPVEEPDEP